MGSKVKYLTSLTILVLLISLANCSLEKQFKNGVEHFSSNLFHELVQSHSHDNIIFSPFSAHTTLAMVRMGTDGETAAEIDEAMGFSNRTSETIADSYSNLIELYDNSNIVKLANKVYIMSDYELKTEYNEILSKKFHSTAESIDFKENKKAASSINQWVESKTNHLIKDLISPEILNSDTRLVLLNAIHFMGNWVKPFNPEYTHTAKFFIEEHKAVDIEMMYIVDRFDFMDFYDFDFSVARLPYKDSDLSMLVFVPMERMGLWNMLKVLKTLNLDDITKEMKYQKAEIMLPKFKHEFEIDLKDSLKELHINRLFSSGDFSKMLKSSELLEISHVLQKATIEVTERGTEAAAASADVAQSRMLPPGLTGDHPFHYVIVNSENVVLFQGNVVKF